MEFYSPEIQEVCYSHSQLKELFTSYPSLPKPEVIESLRDGLMAVCPFKKESEKV
ncbi:hypothetical protein D3C85_1821180 [compost metagenome]